MQNEAKLLNIAEAAQFLKISPDTLRRWEKKSIVTPQRTKGGFRKYTLIDLKIAKLNKRRGWKQNYIHSKNDLKVAFITSFLWILGIFTYQFLTPLLSMPTNPNQQILAEELKQQNHLKIGSETPLIVRPTGKALANNTAIINNPVPGVSIGSDLISHSSSNAPLEYNDSPDKYYSLKPLPNNDNDTLIKRN